MQPHGADVIVVMRARLCPIELNLSATRVSEAPGILQGRKDTYRYEHLRCAGGPRRLNAPQNKNLPGDHTTDRLSRAVSVAAH